MRRLLVLAPGLLVGLLGLLATACFEAPRQRLWVVNLSGQPVEVSLGQTRQSVADFAPLVQLDLSSGGSLRVERQGKLLEEVALPRTDADHDLIYLAPADRPVRVADYSAFFSTEDRAILVVRPDKIPLLENARVLPVPAGSWVNAPGDGLPEIAGGVKEGEQRRVYRPEPVPPELKTDAEIQAFLADKLTREIGREVP